MTDKERNAIGDWTDHPPDVTSISLPPLEQQDPRDFDSQEARDLVIRDRRRAGLPDYPPEKK